MQKLLLLCALFTFAVLPSTAGTVGFTQLCWQANTVTGNEFQNCSDQFGSDSIHVVTPNPDNIDPNNPIPDQIFDGTATTIATPNMWKVFLSTSISDYRRDMYVAYPGQRIPTTGAATAETDDSVTISGGTGVYSLSYIFSIDGIIQSTVGGASLCITLSSSQGTTSSAGVCYQPSDAIPGTFMITYSNTPFLATTNLSLFVQAFWNLGAIDPSDIPLIGADTMTGTALVDFSSTVHLTDVLVTDSNGNPIPGVSIDSSSGYQYPLDPANAAAGVPEPGWMGAVGLAAMAWWRRRR